MRLELRNSILWVHTCCALSLPPPSPCSTPRVNSPPQVTFRAYQIEKFQGEVELRVFGAEKSPTKHLKVLAEVPELLALLTCFACV